MLTALRNKFSAPAAATALGIATALGGTYASAQEAPIQKIAATDAENVNFTQADRSFIIRYNPNGDGFDQNLFNDTLSDINAAGCDVGTETRRYGSFYNLKAPWLNGGDSFRVDDIGTAGGIAIDLCRDGDLGSGPA